MKQDAGSISLSQALQEVPGSTPSVQSSIPPTPERHPPTQSLISPSQLWMPNTHIPPIHTLQPSQELTP